VVTEEDKDPTEGTGVMGLEGDDSGGGGMRKGMGPEDIDDADDIRTMGKDGV